MREIRTSGATRGAGELSLLPPTLPLKELGCGTAALCVSASVVIIHTGKPPALPGRLLEV